MSNIKIRRGVFDTKLELEHASVVAGFPSPADDYTHETLDFNRDYIRHPDVTGTRYVSHLNILSAIVLNFIRCKDSYKYNFVS